MNNKCHICKKEIYKNYLYHYKKCFNSGDKNEFRFNYIFFNYSDFLNYDFVYDLYVLKGYSSNEIESNYNISNLYFSLILEYHKIPKRDIKESRKSKRYINKLENTNIKKYGAKNPLTKGTEPWNKRNKTVLDKYGVENVWQCIDDFVKEYSSRSKYSKLNERVNNILKKSNIKFSHEFRIKYEHENKTKWKFFDFKIDNILIEVNGDYWHANPNIYEKDEIFIFPKRKLKAKEIWEIDTYKKEIAESNGYKVIYIWETELNKMNDGEILQFIKNQIN